MANYKSAKEKIKNSADIVEIIGQFVQLKKAGARYVGLCPFHAEKTPSFTVSPDRQMFHCFGCKKGGDVFEFWMQYHNSSFKETLNDLAEKYNIILSDMDSFEERKKTEKIDSLLLINKLSAEWFKSTLYHPQKGLSGREYLKKRKISERIISEFKLGYAPDAWDGLTGFLKQKGVNLGFAEETGLIIPRKNGGYYDRFRGRVIFPIFNLRQQVIGFGGRILDNSLPKYLNSPESVIFHKGETSYGLNASAKDIREKKRAVIVEGYMDFLTLRDYGLNEAVATLGTALTSGHIRKIKGYAKEIILVFDSDNAGRNAALKSMPVFLNEGISAKVAVLPHGHDPDSFLKENGLTSFLQLLEKAVFILDFFVDCKLEGSGDSVEDKVKALNDILPFLSDLKDNTQRSIYVRNISDKIGVNEKILWSELEKTGRMSYEKPVNGRPQKLSVEPDAFKTKDDLHVLNLLIHYPQTISRLINCDSEILFYDPVAKEVADRLFYLYSKEKCFRIENLLEHLENEETRKYYTEALFEDSHYTDHEIEMAVTEIEKKIKLKKISESLSTFRNLKGDAEALNHLLELKRLNSS